MIKYKNMNQLPEISGLNLFSLEPGVIIALLMDKVTVFGSYKSPGEAAFILDNKKDSRYISRYIHLERTVSLGPDKTEGFYSAAKQPWLQKSSSLRQVPKSSHNYKRYSNGQYTNRYSN